MHYYHNLFFLIDNSTCAKEDNKHSFIQQCHFSTNLFIASNMSSCLSIFSSLYFVVPLVRVLNKVAKGAHDVDTLS